MTGPAFDFLLETCSASGTADYSLGGPPASTPYRGGVSHAGTGGVIDYIVISDVTFKWEIGWGTVTDASPDTLTRNVTRSWDGTTLSNTAKVNWSAGDGTLRMYCGPTGPRINGMLTHHRGTTAPDPAFAGMVWEDINTLTAVVWKKYDGADWITLPWIINETANTVSLSTTTISATDITQTSTDAGASAGPTLTLDRNSATPAATDDIGEIKFTGRDSGAGTDVYTRVYGEIVDPTASSEDGRLGIETKIAGTAADRVFVGAGVYTAGATGGDQGADSVNASAYYDDGVRGQFWPLLATLTASNSATLDFTSVNSTLYSGYEVVIENLVPATDNQSLLWRVSTDGGSNYLATSTYNFARGLAQSTTTSAGAGTAGATSGTLATAMGNTAARSLSGRYTMIVGGAVAAGAKIMGIAHYTATDGSVITQFSGDHNTTTSQVNAFQFLMSSGNITSGTIRVYGIPK